MDGSQNNDVLIVDDDSVLTGDLSTFLEGRGYGVAIAEDVPKARKRFAERRPALCLVDIVMPGPSGKVFCREVSDSSDAGVIMMSSLGDSDTVIAALEIGADDYIVKPFGFPEMLARLRAVMRRRSISAGGTAAAAAGDRIGPWAFDRAARRLVHQDGLVVPLTGSEAEVLRFLKASPGTVFTREDILAVSRVRQHAGRDDRSVDALIKRLRKKLEVAPAEPRHIVTVWGRGYRFDP